MIHPGQGHGRRWLTTGCSLLAATGTARATDAMRTALVVNSRSTASLTIALLVIGDAALASTARAVAGV